MADLDEIFDNFVKVVAHGRSLEEVAVREIATGEMMPAQRGIGAGLVDVIGDFKDALEAAAEAGGCKPTPRFIRPGRSLGQRIFSRTAMGQQSGGQALLEGLGRMMAGGIYYLEPGHIAGGDFSTWEIG